MAQMVVRFTMDDAEFHWDGNHKDTMGPNEVDGMAVAAVLHAVANNIQDEVLEPGSFGNVEVSARRIGRWEVRGD